MYSALGFVHTASVASRSRAQRSGVHIPSAAKRSVPLTMKEFVNSLLLQDSNNNKKKLWVHPINDESEIHGEYHYLFQELRRDEARFSATFE